ncbi:MAG: hypothetical protein ACI8PZ_004628 [Myxococcota bacterium]|jgi:hypothetical protein
MARVEVDFAPEPEEEPDDEASPEPEEAPRERRRRHSEPAVEVEIEREITKRQLIKSVTTLVVVLLYMVFTLLRDRESGVVVVDPDDGDADDWADAD